VSHTPGPWCIADTNDHGDLYIADVDGRRGWVAIAMPSLLLCEEEQAANASLIAAAPELLAACEQLTSLDCTDGYSLVDGEYAILWAALSAARAAIKKANGVA